MQVNELGKNGRGLRGIGDAAGKAKPKVQAEGCLKSDREKVPEESFQDSLQKSMNMGAAADVNGAAVKCGGEWRADSVGRPVSGVISHKEPGFGKGKAEGIDARSGEGSEKETEVRWLAYSECDKVEINVLEGYTLKAKLESKEGENSKGSCSVYVEMKNEEGAVKASLFYGKGLRKDSANAMERIAYAALEGEQDGTGETAGARARAQGNGG